MILLVENALENWIDIESYMSYQAFQIFVDNRDWPGNNIKFWRDHRVGGKWRWILYDTGILVSKYLGFLCLHF